MDNSFKAARHVFEILRDRLIADDELRAELEGAIDMLRSAYNAFIYENRFIVGGALEHLVVAAMNGAGFSAHHIGRGDTRVDVAARAIVDGTEGGFSIKQSASLTVRLINTLGEGVAIWSDPTLFFLDGIGMVYADPELLPNATRRDKDAIIMNGSSLKEFISAHPEWVIPMHIEQPQKGKIASSKTASEDVARSIIRNFKRLSLP